MAHEINFNERRKTHSFYSKGQIAWHRLGQVVEECVSPYEALKLANLDYEVAAAPTQIEIIGSDGSPLIKNVPRSQAIYRTDTNEVFGAVGARYTIVQNEESINFIYNILKLNPEIQNPEDIVIQTAGALGLGERIFVSAKLPANFYVGNESADNSGGTELYIVFTNSHDGTSSLRAIITPVRVVCNNTLSAALHSNKKKVSFRHTKNVLNSLKDGANMLNITYQAFNNTKELHEAMLKVKVNDKIVKDLIAQVFFNQAQLDVFNSLPNKNIELSDDSQISRLMKNRFYDVQECVEGGIGQDLNRGSLLWAYQGINTYLNNGVNYKNYEAKFESLTDGASILKDQKALELCSAMI